MRVNVWNWLHARFRQTRIKKYKRYFKNCCFKFPICMIRSHSDSFLIISSKVSKEVRSNAMSKLKKSSKWNENWSNFNPKLKWANKYMRRSACSARQLKTWSRNWLCRLHILFIIALRANTRKNHLRWVEIVVFQFNIWRDDPSRHWSPCPNWTYQK